MLTLAASDTLAGVASAASQVTCTVFGMELSSGSETYKALYQGQLAASATTIYTVPASTTAFVRSMLLVNNDTQDRTFKIYRGGTAAANAITPTFTLMAGGSAVYEDGTGWTFYSPTGQRLLGSYAPTSGYQDWYGKLYAAYGRCDPQQLLSMATMSGTVAATPTNISTTVARIAYFRPPADITVANVRYFGVGATTSLYHVAIYNGDTLARLTADTAFSTTAATWGVAISGLSLTLTTNQLYFIAVSAANTGTTAGILCMGATQAATTGTIGVLPKSWPGSLAVSSNYMGGFAQFAVTAGALPDPAATIAAQAAWTGGMPLFFLDYA